MRRVKASVWVILWLTLLVSVGPDSAAYAQFLPFYREATCGGNCLYAVCRLKSIDTTLEHVYQLARVTAEGTSMLNLVEAAKKLGLNPQPLKTTVSKLQTTDAYAIVHLKRNHFVLCVGWRGDELVIVDPPKDAYLMSKKDFQMQWTGYALLFSRATELAQGLSQKDSSPGGEDAWQGSSVSRADGNRGQIPEMTRALLDAINKQKGARAEIRGLHKMLNVFAPRLHGESWLNSEPIQIEDLQGEIVVLEFWSVTCGACLGNIEELNRLFQWSQSRPVRVIGLHAYTDDVAQVERVIAERGIRYPICIDKKGSKLSDGRTFEQYGVHGLPRQFLIDVYGRVRSVATVVGPTAEELLEERTDGKQHITEYNLQARYGIHVAPRKVILGTLPVGGQAGKSVHIYKPDDPNFSVSVESTPAAPATVRILRYEDGDALLYELRILVKADFAGEHYSSEVRLRTNDSCTPKITIPVTAMKERQ